MSEIDTVETLGRATVPNAAIPPRPQWLPAEPTSVPPRPKWLSEQSVSEAPGPTKKVATAIDVEDSGHTRPSEWRQDATAFLISLMLHLMVLLVLWLVFRFVLQPSSRGFVITSEIDTGDDGAESDVLTLIDSEVPETQPVTIADTTTVDPAPPTIGSEQPGGAQATNTGGGGGIGFFGSRAEANSVVFVVDKSGSMSNEMRMETAKNELASALRQLEPHQEFYVIFYDTHMVPMLAPKSPQKMQPATRRNIDHFLQWLASDVVPGGGTEPKESLIAALDLHPEVIFFLTDGDIAPETAVEVHLHNLQGTVIHTLCFSNDFGEQVMRRIAQENQGRYRFVDAFSLIAQELERTQKEQRSEDEKKATAMLRNAHRHLAKGRSSTGTRMLQKIIAQFPNSPAAQVAERLLKSLNASK
ncbi:MAG: VWA domain-containing protein [Planctomycetaceae bacterium]|nr:VWA domain-containing protein [Planctomycetaceae bacterium]